MDDSKAVPAPRGNFGAAIAGGLIGAILTAAALIFLAPQYFSSRIVRDGLLSEPSILSDAADALRDQQYAPVLNANRAALETPFASSWKGSQKPDVTIVEFYDYACPYCKASNPHVDRLIAEDKDLRIVYRELPILGPDSLTAARVALTASKAGRFMQFHDALWDGGRLSEETIAKAAGATGIRPATQEDPQIEAELRKNFKLAGELGATGTPVFIVGNRVMNGAVGYETLKKAIEDARS